MIAKGKVTENICIQFIYNLSISYIVFLSVLIPFIVYVCLIALFLPALKTLFYKDLMYLGIFRLYYI